DYDEWGALAGPDWAYDAVLPYFRRAEDTRGRRSAHTGRGGPITVSGQRSPRSLTAAYLAAAAQAGLSRHVVPNADDQDGVMPTMVTQRRGRRWTRGRRLLAPCPPPGQPGRAVRHDGDQSRYRAGSSHRRGIPGRWTPKGDPSRTRGHPGRRRDQLPAVAHA